MFSGDPPGGRVVLYDGDCGFCNSWVRLTVRLDRQARYRFASLQSETGRRLLATCGVPSSTDSVVLIEDGRAYTHSSAVLRICRGLGGVWWLLYLLNGIPKPLRDGVYRWIARRRRSLGGHDACVLPSPELRARFLDDAEEEEHED